MTETRKSPPWYLLTGLVFGVVIGVVISTLIFPATLKYAKPSQLDAVGKDIYREQIALAYAATGHLNRAIDRLSQVNPGNHAGVLIAQAQRLQAAGGSEQVAEALLNLADALSAFPD